MFFQEIDRFTRYAGLARCIEYHADEELFAEYIVVLVLVETFAYPLVGDAGGAVWRDVKHSC